MAFTFKTVRSLHKEGLVHRQLIIRTRILTVVSLVLLGIAAYHTTQFELNPYFLITLAAVGFVLGVTVFSRISPVVWDEEKEVIRTSRMDIFGFAILALYIAFDICLRSYFGSVYEGTYAATGYVLGVIGGSLLGRSVGTLRAVKSIAVEEDIVPEIPE